MEPSAGGGGRDTAEGEENGRLGDLVCGGWGGGGTTRWLFIQGHDTR
jgi:hypothetical protein